MEQRRVIERTPDGWNGVEREGYVPGVATRVVRHTLIGGRRENASDPGPTNELRYFELPAGSVTRLEKHEHEHYVIVGQGVGYAVVGDAVREVREHDVVYTAPFEPHQFVNRGPAPFGFFCLVSAIRDFSQELSPTEIERLLASPAGPYIDPHGAPRPQREARI